MILFPFIILSLLYKKIDKKSICFITIFKNESKSRNKYHIFSGSTRFDNFSTKNNQKKSTSISEVLFVLIKSQFIVHFLWSFREQPLFQQHHQLHQRQW